MRRTLPAVWRTPTGPSATPGAPSPGPPPGGGDQGPENQPQDDHDTDDRQVLPQRQPVQDVVAAHQHGVPRCAEHAERERQVERAEHRRSAAPGGVRPAGPTPPGQSNGFRVSSSAPPTSLVRFQAFSPTLLPSGDQSTLSTTSKARSATQLPTYDPAQPPTIAHAGPHSAPPAVAPATAPPAASPARTPDRMPRSVELRSPRFASSFCCSFHPSQAVITGPTALRALPAPPSVLPITLPFHSLKLAL